MELSLDDIPGPIRLGWVDDVPAYRSGGQVGKLKADRVDPLVGEHDLEPRHRAVMVRSIENPTEGKLELVVLPFASPLNHDVGHALMLPPTTEKVIGARHAELERQLVGVCGAGIGPGVPLLVDHGSHDREIGLIDQTVQFVHEGVTLLPVLQEHERRILLADVAFVEDHDVVAELLELERLDPGNNDMRVVILLEDTEIQDEYGIALVDDLKAVVAALVDEDHIVAIEHSIGSFSTQPLSSTSTASAHLSRPPFSPRR